MRKRFLVFFASFFISEFADADWWKPQIGSSWQIQYAGKLDTSLNVKIYNIDLFDSSKETIANLKAKGKKVICYFSAGSWENWRPDASRFPKSVIGKSNGWDGESWLDIRNIAALSPIMAARMDLAIQKGCDGVDPDNVDGWTNRTGFPLAAAHQLAYNKFLAQEAHARGLAIGLKNDLDQINDLVSHFDFAVNEQCFQYNECSALSAFIKQGKPVFSIEYRGNTGDFCPKANKMNFETLKKRLKLDAERASCR